MKDKKWSYKPLSALCGINLGSTPSRSKSEYWGNGYPWVSISDLKEKFISKTKEEITNAALAESNCKIVKKGTLLMSFKLSIGKLAFAEKDLYTNEAIVALPIKDEAELNKEYLYYVLKSIPLIGGNQAAMGQTLNKQSLSVLQIPIPPTLDDQKRIAKVLSQCENLIQKRKESIDLLDNLLRSTFLEMFGDPIRNEKGWDIESLSIRDFKNGLNYTSNEIGDDVKYLGVGDFKDKWLLDDIDSLKSISLTTAPSEDYFLKNGDLVFVRSNGNKQLVGRCIVVYPNNAKVTFSGFCIRFRPDNNIANPIYLVHLFRNKNFKLKMLRSGRGANIQNINQELLSNLKIPIPPPDLQTNFAHIVTSVESTKKQFNGSLKELENLYGSISQRAFIGELDLSKVALRKTKYFSSIENEIPEEFKYHMEDLINSQKGNKIDSKKKDNEEVKEITVIETDESLKKSAKLIEFIDDRKDYDSYLSKNCQLYIENSKVLRSKIYSLLKEGEIKSADFKNDLIELNKIGAQLHSEVKEYTPWQIDQHKSVERYIAILSDNVLDEYPNLNIFSRHEFDYSSMTLDEYYGIPDDIITEYGSIENHTMDLEFFFKKHFSNKLFSIEELEKVYNQIVYEKGDWFKYEEIKDFIFNALEGDDALLSQSFEEIEIQFEVPEKPKTIKKIMLKVIS